MVAPQSTTPATIRADFVTQIKAITPSHPQHQGETWTYVKNPRDVSSGGKLRRFHIVNEPGERDPDGFTGDGVTYMYDMAVVTSYGDLDAEADDSIITEDGRQLYMTLVERQEPILAGLEYVEHLGFELEQDAETGALVGSHLFRVHYHAAGFA